MKKVTKITLAIAIAIVVVIGGMIFVYVWASGSGPWPPLCNHPEIYFSEVNDTLTVIDISLPASCDKELSDFDLVWENIELWKEEEGNATLPTGTIDVGDIITNCSGGVSLVWKPSDEVIWCSVFSK